MTRTNVISYLAIYANTGGRKTLRVQGTLLSSKDCQVIIDIALHHRLDAVKQAGKTFDPEPIEDHLTAFVVFDDARAFS